MSCIGKIFNYQREIHVHHFINLILVFVATCLYISYYQPMSEIPCSRW